MLNSLFLSASALLIIVAFAVSVFSMLSMRWRWFGIFIVLLLSLVPFGENSLYDWLKGATGELSILTLFLLTGFIIRHLAGWEVISFHTRHHLYFFILLTGFLLYPATLGLSAFDPYSAGFDIVLSLLLLALSLLYWILKQRQFAVILLSVVAAWKLGIMSSLNAWDYLLDPLLWLASPVLLGMMYVSGRKSTQDCNTGVGQKGG